MNIDIKEIYENAKNDSILFSTIDIEALLEKIEKDDNNYLENKCLGDISKDIVDAICEIEETNKEDVRKICDKLAAYRYVERICDLRTGKMMRWIKRASKPISLTNGGILMNVKIENSGIQLLCRNNMNRFFNIKFDDCLIFQKLSMEEQLILMSYGYIENENEN